MKDEYERQKIFILVKEKLIWLIKAQDVKSNFKALAAIKKKISRVRIIEFSKSDGKTSRKREDQATKGLRRMPRYMAPKKDVTSCEKPR